MLKCQSSHNQIFICLCIKGWGIFKQDWNYIFYSSAWGMTLCCSLHLFSCPCFSYYTTHNIYFQFPLGKETLGQFYFAFLRARKCWVGFLLAVLERVLWRRYEKTFSFDTYGTKNYLTQLQGARVFDAVLSTTKAVFWNEVWTYVVGYSSRDEGKRATSTLKWDISPQW